MNIMDDSRFKSDHMTLLLRDKSIPPLMISSHTNAKEKMN